MSTYICKCGRRVKKSTNADNTGNRLEGYGPGHECYGCPYVLSWGNYEWNEEAKNLEQKTKGYECLMSKTLSYASQFIGSTKDKCTCSVVSLDFGFLEQISAWVKETFTLGELTGHFSRDKIRATEYCHNGRYQYALYCAQNKKGIAAKAALFEHFFNSDGSRNDMTPQQEMEKVLTDIRKAKEATECATAQSGCCCDYGRDAVLNAATATSTTSENGADASALNQEASPQGCESGPAVLAESFSAGEAVGGTSSPNLTLPANTKTPTAFDYAGLDTQTVDVLHMAESQYSKGKKMAETGLRWMVNAVSMAHDALCGGVVQQLDNSKHGNRGDDSFRAWCESISLSKSSAYNLLRVAERFGNIEVDGKSILDVQPATLLYAVAETGLRWMVNAVSMAHDALCGGVVQQLDNSKHGNRGDDSFRAWCESISLSKSSAYNLLRVAERFGNIEVDGKSILDVQPATLLYAVAKPSAPAELVAQVKSGDITTHKQYQEALAQIKAEKERADAAEAERDKLLGAQNRAAWAESHIQDVEAQRDAALADVQGLTEQNAKLQQSYHDADESRIAANLQRQKAEAERDRAEARAKDAEDALKHQPITGVVDKGEVQRQAEALSRNAVQEARQQAAEAQARLRQYQEDAEGLLAPAQACAQQAQFIADSVRAMYLNWFGSAVAADASLAQMGTPLYAVCGEIMSSLEEENTINPTSAGSEEDAEREALFE